jgi:hypothetical protein
MTSQEALALLDQATANVAGTRSDHQRIVEALRVLAAVVNPEPEPEP